MLATGVQDEMFAPPEQRAGHFEKVFDYLGNYLGYLALRKDQQPRGGLVDVILRWSIRIRPIAALGGSGQYLVDRTFGGIATTTYVMAGEIHHLATRQSDPRPRATRGWLTIRPPSILFGIRCCTALSAWTSAGASARTSPDSRCGWATLEEWLRRIPDFGVKLRTAPVYETAISRTMKDLHLVF
jgi:hypothetical protein